MCDVAYVLLIDRAERIWLAALSAGAEIDVNAERLKFDQALNAEPKAVDPDKLELMRELGVA